MIKKLRNLLAGGGDPSQRMKRDWEHRARENAMHYIADFRPDWQGDEQAFFASGLDDVRQFLDRAGWAEHRGGSLLEIGCGLGRMTRHLAAHFDRVVGLDVSPTMVQRARELNTQLSNVEFVEGNGVNLGQFSDAHFDRVMSYIVFQHIPAPELVEGYIAEGLRVLAPGGEFFFQARDDHGHDGRNTYDGAAIRRARVEQIAQRAGRSVVRVEGEGTQMCFYLLR